jgi:hypothetical protein
MVNLVRNIESAIGIPRRGVRIAKRHITRIDSTKVIRRRLGQLWLFRRSMAAGSGGAAWSNWVSPQHSRARRPATLFDISKVEYPTGRVLTKYQAANEWLKTIRRPLDLHGITPSMNTAKLLETKSPSVAMPGISGPTAFGFNAVLIS